MTLSRLRIAPRSRFIESLRQSIYSRTANKELFVSSSFRYINPRNHITRADSVSQIFPASTLVDIDDEKLLSLFTARFFGGFTFGAERILLSLGAWRLLPTKFTDFQDHPDATTIWSASDIPRDHLLPVGSQFFGCFKLLDKYISPTSDPSTSYVDYGFGSDEFTFAGCHRFQVAPTISPDSSEPRIRVSIESFICNPQKDELSLPQYMKRFHSIYEKLLFVDAVQSVFVHT
ncbi:hypothetical protein F5884DRAFT_830978 [Xylogone sp. PMI_703]|nr:hypothetical protein F5884DRAFT_830978 [Xylogone sp. PMI_703]